MKPAQDRAAERNLIAGVLRAEAKAVSDQIERLGPEIHAAVDLIVNCADAGGAVLITGMGKSGLIGRKISATLASLGVPSHEIHPAEAVHGDLGRIRSRDLVIALSNSGETEEVVALASALKQDSVPIISITGGEGQSTLARLATVALTLGQITEASDIGLAPTCSTTATLALGDALAIAAAQRRSFTADDFARHHPGGSLGGLLRPVVEVLRFIAGKTLPVVDDSLTLRQALHEGEKLGRRPGAMILVDAHGKLSGIFTDSDLRRLMLKDTGSLDAPVRTAMTRTPKSLPDTSLVRDAVHLMAQTRQDEIPVVDAQGKPVGLLDVQDLITLRVVRG
ncbi:MAG: KpsF/GutQ family sugar-phosphate isomerase [Phycisphaerales bacterium]|nr:KpsF/GutQ family sugar-phosphate isomerase [Phycisphaerales bacterium]